MLKLPHPCREKGYWIFYFYSPDKLKAFWNEGSEGEQHDNTHTLMDEMTVDLLQLQYIFTLPLVVCSHVGGLIFMV